jgi:hypothetical protein
MQRKRCLFLFWLGLTVLSIAANFNLHVVLFPATLSDSYHNDALSGGDALWTKEGHFFPKRVRHGPSSILCVVAKEEEVFLSEFVDYHLALGFDHIFVYDNTADNDLAQWGNETGSVDVIHYPGHSRQIPAYTDCGHNKGRRQGHTWAAFFDVDEFLVLRKHRQIYDFLKAYCRDGSLSLNWILMGSSGEQVYRPMPMSKRFQHRIAIDQHIKTIAYLPHMSDPPPGNPHRVRLLAGRQKDTNGNTVKGAFNLRGPTDVAALYHFQTKSRKEYIQKRLRGRATKNNSHNVEEWIRKAREGPVSNGTDCEFDDAVWQAMKRLVPRYAMFDIYVGTVMTS